MGVPMGVPGVPMGVPLQMGAVPLDQDGSISISTNGRGNY